MLVEFYQVSHLTQVFFMPLAKKNMSSQTNWDTLETLWTLFFPSKTTLHKTSVCNESKKFCVSQRTENIKETKRAVKLVALILGFSFISVIFSYLKNWQWLEPSILTISNNVVKKGQFDFAGLKDFIGFSTLLIGQLQSIVIYCTLKIYCTSYINGLKLSVIRKNR